MTGAREQILAGIRASLGRGRLDEAGLAGLRDRIARHPRHIIPARVARSSDALVALFAEKARAVGTSVGRVAEPNDIPAAVAEYLARENLPARLVQAPALGDLDWSAAPTVDRRTGTAGRDDAVGLTVAFAGIAETGTLVLLSGPDTPTTLNFVPSTHVVVLRREQIVGPYEDAWDRLRRATAATGGWPRTVNLVTGPSRTGDIEQKIQIGVHGPLRVHVILVER